MVAKMRSHFLFILLGTVFWAECAFGIKLPRKSLAGPPSEFEQHKIPKPFAGALQEVSAFYKMELQESLENPGEVEWDLVLPVDSPVRFAFTFFSPIEDQLQLTLLDPTGTQVNLNDFKVKGTFPIGLHEVPATNFVFEKPVVGEWNLHVFSKNLDPRIFADIMNANVPQGAVFLYNESPLKMYTYLNSYATTVGTNIGLITTVTKDTQFSKEVGATPWKLDAPILQADLDMVTPDGQVVDVGMSDDGLHGDGRANDGLWGATIPATMPGVYRAQAVFKGIDNDGNVFVRTTQHLVSVVEKEVQLTGTATALAPQNNRVSIRLGVSTEKSVRETTEMWRAYAEVWGSSNVPICWIGGMVVVDESDGNAFVTLDLDLRWVTMAKAKGPFTLKNVYIAHASANIPVSTMNEIPVTVQGDELQLLMTIHSLEVTEITREMRFGRLTPRNLTQEKSGLVLIHGYCSDRNPWEIQAKDWSGNLGFFLNANSNIGNQDFSELVDAFAENLGFTSFGAVGHSQGGMVALHLLNYFETGLDYAQSGRRIQSVGTPYQGNTVAGTAADIGDIFGVGCGSIFDLTKDGAALWLSGISQEIRKEVYYYTTTYELGKFFGDYCSLAANFGLKWPNDGTCEFDLAPLVGGNNMGNKEKWCHTTDMGYPAQYFDATRNVEMNGAAAR